MRSKGYQAIGISSFFLFSFILCFNSSAQLKVTEVADKVLASNPDLQRTRKKIKQADGLRIQAGSAFNTSYTAGVNKLLNYTNYTYESPTRANQINSWNYAIGASRKLPWGTVIMPSLLVNKTGLQESFPNVGNTLINQGAAALRVSQPLLLGFGKKYTMAALRTSELDLSAAEHQYIFQASSILAQTFEAYIQYIGAYQSLLIQIQTEATITKSITDINRLIALDALPASEVVLLTAQLYNQKAMRKLAQNRLLATKNLLGSLMGMEDVEISNLALPDTVFPVNEVSGLSDSSFVLQWLNKAELLRGDFLGLDKNISSAEINAFVSMKNIKPKLDLNLSAGYTGIAQATAFNQYYLPLIQNIPGLNYSIGLSFVFAGKNDLARGQRINSNATLDVLKDQRRALVLSVRNQIKLSANNYLNFAQVVSYLTESVKSYKKAYQNEVLKFQAGTTTSFALVQVQNNYLMAKNQLINVLTDLNIAVIELRHHTGTLIEPQSNNTFNFDPLQLFTLPVVK